MMESEQNIQEISAEMLLGYFYPELEDRWISRHEGTFFRNYSEDVLDVDAQRAEVSLSRDGFLKLLPEGMLDTEDELRGGKDVASASEALQKRLKILREATLPLDSFHFRQKLRLERSVAELLEEKDNLILDKFFDVRLGEGTDKYVRKAAGLLNAIRNLRGNMGLIRSLLETVLECPVEMTTGRYSETDNTVSWLPMVRYTLIVPGLDPEGYRRREEEIRPLCNFLLEWFIPVDTKCIFAIRQSEGRADTSSGLVLDYNIDID